MGIFFQKGFVLNRSGKKQVKVTYTSVISKNNTMGIFATEIQAFYSKWIKSPKDL